MTHLKRNRWRNRSGNLKENLTVFAVLSGLAALSIQVFTPSKVPQGESNLLVDYLKFAAVVLGLIYLFIFAREDTAKRSREEFKEFIDNKRNLRALINDIFRSQVQSSVFDLSERECTAIVQAWHKSSDEKNRFRNMFWQKVNAQSYIDDIGIEDFTYLLLTKAENSGLIKVTASGQGLNLNLYDCMKTASAHLSE